MNKGLENGVKLYLEEPKNSVMAVRKDNIDKVDIGIKKDDIIKKYNSIKGEKN